MGLNITNVTGLGLAEQEMLSELVSVYNYHIEKNKVKEKYYEGNIDFQSVNLGIAIPKVFKGLEVGCSWGAKAVDVLAGRSRFDGFVGTDGNSVEQLTEIMENNHMVSAYSKACTDELKFGCTFATLSADKKLGCRIRFHTPKTASALWDGEKDRIQCGMAIIDTVPDDSKKSWQPSLINLYTDTAVWEIKKENNGLWVAKENKHPMGRPLMEPLIWNSSSEKPFGRSRLDVTIRRMIDSYVRTFANTAIAQEFATSPQKYMLGVTEDQFDAICGDKFRTYMGSIIATTPNPETGENPVFGQLPQGTVTPQLQTLKDLSAQFGAATGLPVTETGVVNDANPTSSEAILAQTQTLIRLAETLNEINGETLKTIALMALAIANNTTVEALSEDERNIIAHFKNPAMLSVAATADAALKIATANPEFSKTDLFFEMTGFSQADIRRINAQMQRARGMQLLQELNLNENKPE